MKKIIGWIMREFEEVNVFSGRVGESHIFGLKGEDRRGSNMVLSSTIAVRL